MNLRIEIKLVLASLSGVLLVIAMEFIPTPDSELLGGLLSLLHEFGLPGTIFAIPILWPYLRHDDHFLLRGLALIAASVLSYWCALQALSWIPHDPVNWGPVLADFIVASIVGAGIVFVAARFIVPFHWSLSFLLLGLLAGVVGGWAFDALEDFPGPEFIASFVVWHCIVCAALHFGTQRQNQENHA